MPLPRAGRDTAKWLRKLLGLRCATREKDLCLRFVREPPRLPPEHTIRKWRKLEDNDAG